MENNQIQLPYKLGLKVWEILKEKHSIQPRKNKIGLIDFNFTQEELQLITRIKLANPVAGELQGINFLPNLQTLEIESTAITAHQQEKNIASIDDKDIEEIAKCTTLKSLSIVNQAKVSYVDVANLGQLQDLTISHNQHLEEIFGIEQLEDLWILNCYGNNRLPSIDKLDELIMKNKELAELNLDVLLFPSAINFNSHTGQYSAEALSFIQELAQMQSVKWSESLNGNRSININTHQMIQLHNKACEILAHNVPDSSDMRDTIIGIEEYLSRTVKYDYEGAKHRSYKHY